MRQLAVGSAFITVETPLILAVKETLTFVARIVDGRLCFISKALERCGQCGSRMCAGVHTGDGRQVRNYMSACGKTASVMPLDAKK